MWKGGKPMAAGSSTKASLPLVELMVAILVFSLSSAVALYLFLSSHSLSRLSADTNAALLECQALAEEFKAEGGQAAVYYYDADWQAAREDSAAYQITVSPAEEENSVGGKLARAEIVASRRTAYPFLKGRTEILRITAGSYFPGEVSR
jgi:type II secretory pathway pseudopilin PulG